jgi:hypothetical protein
METTHIASLCQHADLIGVVTDSWIEAVGTGSISGITLAIQIAERYGLSSVKGRAYYAMMILDSHLWDQDGVLTVQQRLRLLSGFHHLAQQCHLLEQQGPPEITHSACTLATAKISPSPSGTRCRSAWITIWKLIFVLPETRRAFVSFSPADFISRLSYIVETLKRLDDTLLRSTGGQMAAECLQSALAKVEAMSEECRRNLPEIFVDLK